MRKFLKILSGLVAFIIIAFVLLFADGFLGNPISKHLAQKGAKKYIEKNYKDMNYKIDKTQYNFKNSDYYVKVKSAENSDLDFYLSVTRSGKLRYDSYDDDVVNGFNIWSRLDGELRKLGKDFFEKELAFEIVYANFGFEKSEFENGLFTSGLALDIMNPPLPIYASVGIIDSDTSYEKAAKLLSDVHDLVVKYDYPISFYNISIEYKPINSDEKEFYKSLYIYNIPSDLLQSDDLVAALKEFDSSQNVDDKK